MSVDDGVLRDPRITLLAQLVGWSRRETLGALIEIWAICYDRIDCSLGPAMIDLVAHRTGFAQLMIQADLAVPQPSGKLRIAGAKDRIGYLASLKQFGREGGLKSAEMRRNEGKGSAKGTGNLIPPDPVPDPAPVPDLSKIPPKPPPKPPRGRARKPVDPTDAERASVRVILDKLGAHTGTAYMGATEHTRLIVARLRDGLTEMDLRQVVAYCALELQWAKKPDMAPYLRPETLFGPKTVWRYVDAARAFFSKLPEDKAQ